MGMPHIRAIHPDGSIDQLPCVALGAVHSQNLILPSQFDEERDRLHQWNQLPGYQEEAPI